jgi:arginase
VTPPGRRPVVIEAPSNLGLSPPEPGSVPGVYKLAGALRECRLPARIAASDGGVVVPPRYRADWDGQTVRNREAIASYSPRLADRIIATLDGGGFPVVLGGDCSILLGAMSALRRRGRYGLIFVDGHLDFRHPGNSPNVRAAAGEDLALVTGRGASELVDLEELRPYVQDTDVQVLGARDADEHSDEVRAAGIGLATVSELRRIGFRRASEQAIARLQRQGVDGFWIHLDLDVVDSALLPAVDSPEPAGLSFDELRALLVPLLASRLAVGIEVTIFDPDLDESGQQAAVVTDLLVAAFEASGRAAALPPTLRHTTTREAASGPPSVAPKPAEEP